MKPLASKRSTAVAVTVLLATIVLLSSQARAAEKPSPAAAPLAPSSSAVTTAWIAFKRAWTEITAYSATVTFFERNGTEVQHTAFDYVFRKPSSASIHYNEGVNAGVTAEWNGGNTVVAHRGSGLMALFKKTFALHDPEVMTIRGASIDQLSFAAILAHAQDTPGAISESAGPVIDGVATDAVTLTPSSASTDNALTREIVDISTATNLPIRVLGYEGQTLVRQIDFSNVTLQN